MEPWDVTIVGGGILGTSVAYWLAARDEGRIAVLEPEPALAPHASRRDTGGLHPPAFLPEPPGGGGVRPRGGNLVPPLEAVRGGEGTPLEPGRDVRGRPR